MTEKAAPNAMFLELQQNFLCLSMAQKGWSCLQSRLPLKATLKEGPRLLFIFLDHIISKFLAESKKQRGSFLHPHPLIPKITITDLSQTPRSKEPSWVSFAIENESDHHYY